MTTPLRKLRIINGNGAAERSLQELTRRMRFMEEFGIDAEYVGASDGQQGLDALLEGRGDVCLQIGFGPALAAIEKGKKLKVLAGANLRAVHALFSSKPEIRNVKDLEGATVGIGTRGALTHQLITAVLLKAGADPSKVKFVSIGNSETVFKAVATRQVDAGLGEVDNLHQQTQFAIHALPDGNLWDQIPEFTNQASYATQEAIDTKRDLIVASLAASASLYRYICVTGSWDKFLEARVAATPEADPGEAKAQWGFYQERKPYAMDLVIGGDRLRYLQEINVAMGLQKKILSYDKVADASLAEEALRLLTAKGL
jgi:ABC-type nitrate/sulfonate/bicarbonate transport system substrate-binding protein